MATDRKTMRRAKRAKGVTPVRPVRKRAAVRGRPKLSVAPLDAEMRIREAALDLFSTRGFSAVTVKDIADATGHNPALVFYYFGSKEELFRSTVTLAVERAFDHFRIAREGLTHPRDIIHGWLDTHVREYETISKLIKISMDYAKTAKRKTRIDGAIRRFYDEERAVLRSTLSAGIASGDFRLLDVDETATFISTYLDGVFARAMILDDFDPIAAIGELRTFLSTYLHRPRRGKA